MQQKCDGGLLEETDHNKQCSIQRDSQMTPRLKRPISRQVVSLCRSTCLTSTCSRTYNLLSSIASLTSTSTRTNNLTIYTIITSTRTRTNYSAISESLVCRPTPPSTTCDADTDDYNDDSDHDVDHHHNHQHHYHDRPPTTCCHQPPR